MGLPNKLLEALKNAGLEKPTPIQCEAIPVAVQGSDLIGVAQTGSGKTLAYALSVLTILSEKTKGRALILLPSRETAVQVHDVILPFCTELAITVCLAVAGIPNAIQTKQLKKNPQLIIATPGRLEEHLKNNKLMLQGLSILVLDEADRMLSMGFEAQLAFMKSTLRGSQQTLMFAATFGPLGRTHCRNVYGERSCADQVKGCRNARGNTRTEGFFSKPLTKTKSPTG